MGKSNNINVLQAAYEKRQGKKNDENRKHFRQTVISKCDWSGDNMFYRKRKGLSKLSKLEEKEIKTIDRSSP